MRIEVRAQFWLSKPTPVSNTILEITHFGSYSFISETLPFCFFSSVVAPVIRNPREETITVEVSHSVTLTCEASGVPDVRVVWRFGNIPISSQNNRYQMATNGSLYLREVQVIDSGNFTCIAKNTAGRDTRVITLNVIGGI